MRHRGRRAASGSATTVLEVATDVATARLLAQRTLELVDIPSVSRDEARIAEYVDAAVPRGSFEELYADGEAFFYTTPRTSSGPLVVLAGHFDTIPAQDNLPGRIDAGWVEGLGASDMKGGLAVMLELAAWVDEARPEIEVDLGLLFFAREELPVDESPLPSAFAGSPDLRAAQLAIVLEPTDNTIQAGCLGNLNAVLTFRGVSAHSARPWQGENAIGRAVEGLLPLTRIPPQPVEIQGLVYTEVLSVTRIDGGLAHNVIPDVVTAGLNYRFAPDRTAAEAEQRLRELVNDVGELEITSNSPPGRVSAQTPLVRRLQAAGEFELAPKQAWTPVAQFTEVGIDAVNLGPGATRYAHARDERVSITELVRTFDALRRFVTRAG
jgi:succinyl-diaminopimelate desuccinylase